MGWFDGFQMPRPTAHFEFGGWGGAPAVERQPQPGDAVDEKRKKGLLGRLGDAAMAATSDRQDGWNGADTMQLGLSLLGNAEDGGDWSAVGNDLGTIRQGIAGRISDAQTLKAAQSEAELKNAQWQADRETKLAELSRPEYLAPTPVQIDGKVYMVQYPKTGQGDPIVREGTPYEAPDAMSEHQRAQLGIERERLALAQRKWEEERAGGSVDFENETKFRSEFAKATNFFPDVRDAYKRVHASENTGAGDVALVFNYMKMLDPASAVREGEFATAEQTAGMPQQVVSLYNRALSGERLTPVQRTNFLSQADALYGRSEESYRDLSEQYSGLARQYGMDPERVVMDYRAGAPSSLPQRRTSGIPFANAGGDGSAQNGMAATMAGPEDAGSDLAGLLDPSDGSPITEDDIQQTMQANGMSRDEVLAVLRGGQ